MSKKRSIVFASILLATVFILILIFRYVYPHLNEDTSFKRYTRNLFCQEVSSNTITLHYTLKDPSAYDITDVPVTFGSFSSNIEAICAASENALSLLHSFHSDCLSSDNALTYQVLDEYLELSMDEGNYTLYNEPLAPMTGTQAQLPVLLSEYQFYGQNDVDTYLTLLTQTPAYFDSLLAFEQAKSDAGLFMPSYSADAIVEECQSFVAMGEQNYLIDSFDDRLEQLELRDDLETDYKKQNEDYIKNYVFSAYNTLADGITELRDTGQNDQGLCYFPEGKDYYEILVAAETGSSRNVQELQELTLKQISEDMTALQTTLANITSSNDSSGSSTSGSDSSGNDSFGNDSSDNDSFGNDSYGSSASDSDSSGSSASGNDTSGSSASSSGSSGSSSLSSITLADSNPSSILATLATQISGDFPALPAVHTTVKYVQESMEEYLSPAFYMIPPLDDNNENIIYINAGHISSDMSLFTTLAHEGYPGHLYQTVYYENQSHDPIRSLLNFGGYTEGWATYSEMLSYYYAPIEKSQALVLQKNASIILGLYALADMGIHYDGWSLTDTISFFSTYGITDADTIQSIYKLIIADPANYLKYYIGYVEFLELKKEAIEAWGDDFTQERFHRAVLDAGPAGFEIIEEYMLEQTN
jgi:uncharacterized protein (DUF885 family)